LGTSLALAAARLLGDHALQDARAPNFLPLAEAGPPVEYLQL